MLVAHCLGNAINCGSMRKMSSFLNDGDGYTLQPPGIRMLNIWNARFVGFIEFSNEIPFRRHSIAVMLFEVGESHRPLPFQN